MDGPAPVHGWQEARLTGVAFGWDWGIPSPSRLPSHPLPHPFTTITIPALSTPPRPPHFAYRYMGVYYATPLPHRAIPASLPPTEPPPSASPFFHLPPPILPPHIHTHALQFPLLPPAPLSLRFVCFLFLSTGNPQIYEARRHSDLPTSLPSSPLTLALPAGRAAKWRAGSCLFVGARRRDRGGLALLAQQLSSLPASPLLPSRTRLPASPPLI